MLDEIEQMIGTVSGEIGREIWEVISGECFGMTPDPWVCDEPDDKRCRCNEQRQIVSAFVRRKLDALLRRSGAVLSPGGAAEKDIRVQRETAALGRGEAGAACPVPSREAAESAGDRSGPPSRLPEQTAGNSEPGQSLVESDVVSKFLDSKGAAEGRTHAVPQSLRELLVRADSYLSLLWYRHTPPNIKADSELRYDVERTIGELREASKGEAAETRAGLPEPPCCERHGVMVARDQMGREWYCAVCGSVSPDTDTAPSHLILLAEDGADKCWGCRDCSAKVWTSAEPSIYWHSRECLHYGKMDTDPSQENEAQDEETA